MLLLILAGALIALYFHGLGGLIHRKLHLAKKWSLLLAILISLLLLTLFIAFAGDRIGQQIDGLTQTLPATIENVKQQLSKSSIGRQVLQRISSEGNMQKMSSLLVAGLYIVVQVLESNFITPQIQKRLVSIPPALIIIAQLMMGVLTGGWGLIVATPLILILITVTGELYIKKQHK